jgi:hypothetical protein
MNLQGHLQRFKTQTTRSKMTMSTEVPVIETKQEKQCTTATRYLVKGIF